jgi:hypothetical protein
VVGLFAMSIISGLVGLFPFAVLFFGAFLASLMWLAASGRADRPL